MNNIFEKTNQLLENMGADWQLCLSIGVLVVLLFFVIWLLMRKLILWHGKVDVQVETLLKIDEKLQALSNIDEKVKQISTNTGNIDGRIENAENLIKNKGKKSMAEIKFEKIEKIIMDIKEDDENQNNVEINETRYSDKEFIDNNCKAEQKETPSAADVPKADTQKEDVQKDSYTFIKYKNKEQNTSKNGNIYTEEQLNKLIR